MKRLAVYTALTGGYDTLRQPERVREDVDYFCFSNDIHQNQIGAWRICPINHNQPDGIRLVRFVKLNPELFLPTYKTCLWVDSNITLTNEIQDRAIELLNSNTLVATLPHSTRSSVFDEGLYLLQCGKGKSGEVLRQIRHLLRERYPDKFGLKETCIFFRRHSHPSVMEFDRIWWSQLERFSTRDQLGCDYALWKADLDCVLFSDSSILERCQRKHNPISNHITPKRILMWAIRMIHLRIAKRVLRKAF